jgi:hypothetical protein
MKRDSDCISSPALKFGCWHYLHYRVMHYLLDRFLLKPAIFVGTLFYASVVAQLKLPQLAIEKLYKVW